MAQTPEVRVQALNDAPVDASGTFALYWMMAYRRLTWNFSLDRAIEWARRLHIPLVIVEELRCGNRWDSDRLHRFVLDGMRDNAARCARARVLYHPFVEGETGEADDLVAALAQRACVVVTDEFPVGPWAGITARMGRRIGVRLEQVDSNGVLPLRATERVFPTAYAFRAFLQKNLHRHLRDRPKARPLARLALPQVSRLPREILMRWPRASAGLLQGRPEVLAGLPIDHSVPMVEECGGPKRAKRVLKRFLSERLDRYAASRNRPEERVASDLSPYLHFGHIAAHRVFADLIKREDWSVDAVRTTGGGKRSGWWGMSENAEAFLDQLITWREVGYNMSSHREEYEAYDSLPHWARHSLAEHAGDLRPYLYTPAELERAQTHDALWNAAQRQLVREGRIHNYLRMLWGKKILEWSPTPQEALETMIHLNNTYALDGRDPNSYSGIFWVLGRYDRSWGPERPIFGKVRYMSSENTARKVPVRNYIREYTMVGERTERSD